MLLCPSRIGKHLNKLFMLQILKTILQNVWSSQFQSTCDTFVGDKVGDQSKYNALLSCIISAA